MSSLDTEESARRMRERQHKANIIKSKVKELQIPYEDRVNDARAHYMNTRGFTAEEALIIHPQTDIQIRNNIFSLILGFLSIVDDDIQTRHSDINSRNTELVVDILKNEQFRENFTRNEYNTLLEELGMENMVGGSRIKHRKKSNKSKKLKKSINKKHKRKSRKSRKTRKSRKSRK